MQSRLRKQIAAKLEEIKNAGLYKPERALDTPQQNRIRVRGGNKPLINLCANNYLALANDRHLINAAKQALDDWGYGLASARLICGTQSIHKTLEGEISAFLGTEATILYPSCFDANAGLFETLLDEEDAVISDELNHASIIDGIRLSKAQRFRYRNCDMRDLEQKLQESAGARHRLIATDGVFSMDGYIARLPEICDLAEKYDAVVMIDDSHAVGCVGANGRGTHEHHGVMDRVDIITGTLAKALGGASGGYASGSREVIELLRQRSRPYLFSNAVAPPIVAASLTVLKMLANSSNLRERLKENTRFFRSRMESLGFQVLPGEHPIVPVMLGDATVASRMAELLLTKGVYVIAFSYPIVPQGKARIRVQLSAGHTQEDLEFAITQFGEARYEMGL
jgi:glycine C-acetyltransferase